MYCFSCVSIGEEVRLSFATYATGTWSLDVVYHWKVVGNSRVMGMVGEEMILKLCEDVVRRQRASRCRSSGRRGTCGRQRGRAETGPRAATHAPGNPPPRLM